MARQDYRLATSIPVPNVTRVLVTKYEAPDDDAGTPLKVTVLLLPNKTASTPAWPGNVPLTEKEERGRAYQRFVLSITNTTSDGLQLRDPVNVREDALANPYTDMFKRVAIGKAGLMDACMAAEGAATGVDNKCAAIAAVLNDPANGVLPAHN